MNRKAAVIHSIYTLIQHINKFIELIKACITGDLSFGQ